MDPLRIGVVGVGHLGRLHAKMLAAMEGVRFVGVFDMDPAKAGTVASEFDTRPFATLEALLAEVDAVTVATTTTAHFAVARAALEGGVHVFLEKPITETIPEAEELCRLAAEAKLTVQVGHIERFNPAILALDGFPLQPLFVESHRLAQFKPRGTDVAVVLDLMIHDIDLILTFVKSPVHQIDASGVAVVSDTIDIANARIQFENGCVANVTASRISQRSMRKMRMFQPNAYISLDFSEGLAEVFRLLPEDAADVRGAMVLGEMGLGKNRKKIVYEQPEPKEVNALRYELELFVNAVRNGTPPPVTADDARRALEVATSIMQKISQQRMPG
jgi:predicted dehydrogenase